MSDNSSENLGSDQEFSEQQHIEEEAPFEEEILQMENSSEEHISFPNQVDIQQVTP